MSDGFSFTWGVATEGDGYLQVFEYMLRVYTSMGVTRQEFLLICHLASYHYNVETGECHPGLATLAKQMGYKNRETVSRLVTSLRDKGFLEVIERPGETSLYRMVAFATRAKKQWEETRGCDLQVTGRCDLQVTGGVTYKSHESDKVNTLKKAKRGTDTNPKRAAIRAFRDATGRWPRKILEGRILEAVGSEEVDVARWFRTVDGWVAMGWNPQNLKGMLDFYARNEIPGDKQRGQNHHPDGANTAAPVTVEELQSLSVGV